MVKKTFFSDERITMRVAVINLTGGGISGGYRKYLHKVIPRMAVHPKIESILCASPPALNVQNWVGNIPNVKFVTCRPFSFMCHKPEPELREQVKHFSPDVLFIPVERYLKFSEMPFVTMIQNMGPLASPVRNIPVSERIKYMAQTIETKIAVSKADRIIAISGFVRDFLINRWKVSSDRISVVYNGCDLVSDKDKAYERPTLVLNDWKGKFLFTAGSIEPYRGLEDILYAMKYLQSFELGIDVLVIAGDSRFNMVSYRDRLKKWLQKNNLSTKVCWTGNLNQDEMAWCYQNCYAFIMTSRVEACPNIALESMANGCVCISADNPPMPEIFGDSAVYYPPKNAKALAETIQTVITWNSDQRNEASERARNRAAEFSWDLTVEKTLAELNKAVHDFRMRGDNTK